MADFCPWDGLAFYSTADHCNSLIASLSKHHQVSVKKIGKANLPNGCL
jgi:hypothetical protein